MIRRFFAALVSILLFSCSASGKATEAYRVNGEIPIRAQNGMRVFLAEVINGNMQETPIAQAVVGEEGFFSFLNDDGEEALFAPGLYALYTMDENQRIGSVQIFRLLDGDIRIVFESSEMREDCGCL